MSLESANIDTTSKVLTQMSPGISSPAVEAPIKTGKTAQAHVVTPIAQSSPKASVENVAGEAFDQLHKLALSSDAEGFKVGQGKLAAEVAKIKDGKVEARNHWTSVAGRVFLKILTLTIVFAPLTLTILSRSEAAHKREMDQLDKLGSEVGSISQEDAKKEAVRAAFQKNCLVFERPLEGLKKEFLHKKRVEGSPVEVGGLQVPAFINNDILRTRHLGVIMAGQGKISSEPGTVPLEQRPVVVDSFCQGLVAKLRHTESEENAKNIAGNILALSTQNALSDESNGLIQPPVFNTRMSPNMLEPELTKNPPLPMTEDILIHIDNELCHQTVMGMFQIFEIGENGMQNVRYQILTVERHIPIDVMRATPEDLASGTAKMDGMKSVAAHSPTFSTQAEALAYLQQASQIAKNGPLIK